MKRTPKLILTTAALTALGAATAPAASNHSVDMTATARLAGSGLKVTMSGRPIGNCSGTAQILSNGAKFNARCKHGRIRVRVKFAKGNRAKGTWRFTSGTGRYANGAGSGRYVGNIAQLRFRMTGSARY